MSLKNLKNLFLYYDKNKDGKIDIYDYKHIINILGLPIIISENKIEYIFTDVIEYIIKHYIINPKKFENNLLKIYDINTTKFILNNDIIFSNNYNYKINKNT